MAFFQAILDFFKIRKSVSKTDEDQSNADNGPKKEINMLLMGQTGVGKSTFINALAYYLNCKDLKEATSADLHCLIPCSFALTGKNYEETVIKYGVKNDGNENLECKGESSTQNCKSYLFEMDRFILRIIDTPGIGDTRGIDQDKLNMENILDYISPLKQLHGICFLFKPNESRLTSSFEYCLKQLLCHLHKNASKNIFFVFTNSRGSFYKPGDSIVPLREIINRLKDSVKVPLNDDSIICVDNEAFRYLVALKNNFQFQKNDFENFNASWKKSVTEYWRMIKLITDKLRIPHEIEETLTLNDIKEMILIQLKPISDISKLIQLNYDSLDKHLVELRKYTEDCEELKSKLYVPMIKPKMEEFEDPRAVCTSEKCRQCVEKDGIMQYYPKICHDPCYLQNVPRNTDGLEELKGCLIFGGGENCTRCSCSYLEHRHIYYLIEQVFEKDESNKTKLDAANGFKDKIEIIVKACEERIIKLKEEENLILQYIGNLEVFFEQNAILPYNDAFCKYLKQLIESQESLKEAGANSEKVVEGLKNMEKRYREENEHMKNVRGNNNEKISIEVAKKLIGKLFKLEFSGGMLKSILDSRLRARSEELTQKEIKVPIKIRRCPQ